MSSNSNTEVNDKIIGFAKSVEMLENAFNEFKKKFDLKNLNKDEFETVKINLLEDLRKAEYEINQFKEKLSLRDEKEKVLLEELNLLSEQFQTEIDEDTGIATIYLSASIETHFEIDVDCSKYPEPPYIFIPKEINDFFDGKIVTELKSLQKWSVKKPPHIVDIFKELEKRLVDIFFKNNEIIEDRERIANRRKLIESARVAEETGDLESAINLYEVVIKISQDLKDKKVTLKYKKKLEEVKAHLK